MPHTVTLADAKTHLEDLIAEARRGEEVLITDGDNPVVKLTPAQEQTNGSSPDAPNQDHSALIGLWKDKIVLKEGWDDPLEEMRPYME